LLNNLKIIILSSENILVLFLQRSIIEIETGYEITFCFEKKNLTDLPRKRRSVRIKKNLCITILPMYYLDDLA